MHLLPESVAGEWPTRLARRSALASVASSRLTVTSGKVLAILPAAPYEGLAGKVLEISNKTEHGNSGSPLLDSAGEVVGVVYYLRPNGDALAMPVSSLKGLLQDQSTDSSPLECVDLSG
jgi:S1-C subfamily serine protease